LQMTVTKSRTSKAKPMALSSYWLLNGQAWSSCAMSFRCTNMHLFFLLYSPLYRSRPMLSSYSQHLCTPLFGTPSQYLNFYKRHGETWLLHRNVAVSRRPSNPVSLTLANGIERQMTLMSILYALVILFVTIFLTAIHLECSFSPQSQCQSHICKRPMGHQLLQGWNEVA
jgi:hypothetical protein